jgi:uncharacterized protein YecT (DUF1311 family)
MNRGDAMIRQFVTILGCAALLFATGCKEGEIKADNPNVIETVAPEPAAASSDGTDICGSQPTYNSVKDIIFDEAIKQAGGNPVPLNDLRRGVSVRMEFPLVKGINEQLKRTDCSGRLTLGLPPGVSSAFGGEPALKADLTYSVQPAADGNGAVITAEGIQYLVGQLVAADSLRSAQKLAQSGGPQTVKTYNPSFDCGARLSNIERMICQDESLAGKDRDLSAGFKQFLSYLSGAERSEALANQRELLQQRARCADTQCVNDWYDSALSNLQ